MRINFHRVFATPLSVAGMIVSAHAARLIVQMDQPGTAVSPTLYGAFFEDINRAGDGGLYAEMLQNRSFEDNASSLIAWTPLTNANAVVTFGLDHASPLNTNNPTSLKIHIRKTGGGWVGIFNQGFKGIAATGMKKDSDDLTLKVVNRGGKPESVNINLSGLAKTYFKGVCMEMSAFSLAAGNSFAEPDKISPKTSALPAFSQGVEHLFPAYSVTILRWSQN